MDTGKSDKARRYTYNLLRIRSRSEKEVDNRLREKGFSDKVVRETIAFFKKNRLIDDLEFAKAWVDSRLKTSPRGKITLRQELAGKGVSPRVIEQALSAVEEDETEVIRRLAEKRIKLLKSLPEVRMKKRLFDYLKRRGFDSDCVEDIVNSVAEKRKL